MNDIIENVYPWEIEERRRKKNVRGKKRMRKKDSVKMTRIILRTRYTCTFCLFSPSIRFYTFISSPFPPIFFESFSSLSLFWGKERSEVHIVITMLMALSPTPPYLTGKCHQIHKRVKNVKAGGAVHPHETFCEKIYP